MTAPCWRHWETGEQALDTASGRWETFFTALLVLLISQNIVTDSDGLIAQRQSLAI